MSTLKLIRLMRAELEKEVPPIKVLEAQNVKGHVHLWLVREDVECRISMGGTPKCLENELRVTLQRIRRFYRTKELT